MATALGKRFEVSLIAFMQKRRKHYMLEDLLKGFAAKPRGETIGSQPNRHRLTFEEVMAEAATKGIRTRDITGLDTVRGRGQVPKIPRAGRLAHLMKKAIAVWGSKRSAAGWLKSPNASLGGKSPLRVASTAVGVRQIEDLLGKIAYRITR